MLVKRNSDSFSLCCATSRCTREKTLVTTADALDKQSIVGRLRRTPRKFIDEDWPETSWRMGVLGTLKEHATEQISFLFWLSLGHLSFDVHLQHGLLSKINVLRSQLSGFTWHSAIEKRSDSPESRKKERLGNGHVVLMYDEKQRDYSPAANTSARL